MAQAMTPHHLPEFHLGDRLRKARESSGYRSASAFADAIGISRDSLRKYEAAVLPPTRAIVTEWSLATGVPAAELWGPDDPDGVQAMSLRRARRQRKAPTNRYSRRRPGQYHNQGARLAA